jgi:hypothetical protein
MPFFTRRWDFFGVIDRLITFRTTNNLYSEWHLKKQNNDIFFYVSIALKAYFPAA